MLRGRVSLPALADTVVSTCSTAAKVQVAPGHNKTIATRRSKCSLRCLEVLHILECSAPSGLLDGAAISATVRMASGPNRSMTR